LDSLAAEWWSSARISTLQRSDRVLAKSEELTVWCEHAEPRDGGQEGRRVARALTAPRRCRVGDGVEEAGKPVGAVLKPVERSGDNIGRPIRRVERPSEREVRATMVL
jgi:hypothetical protein